MRTMYDAVTASNIPRTAAMVAGYVDKIKLEPWSAADWARFPNAVKVGIVKKASSNFGHVLDVEPGDATPAEAPGWVQRRRATGADPTIYMNLSTWPVVRKAFADQNVPPPHYWVAKYDMVASIPADWLALGCVAKQYGGDVPGGYDLSIVVDHWPGVDSAGQEENVAFTKDDFNAFMWGNVFDTNGSRNYAAFVKDMDAKLTALGASNAALSAAVAKLSVSPDITVETLTAIVDEAIKQHVQITGTVEIGPKDVTS